MIKISQDITVEPVVIADVKQFIKFNATDASETTLIEDMIKGVRVYIEKRTGLALAEKTIIEYFTKEYTGEYVLSLTPVISVDSVSELDMDEDATALTLNSDYWLQGLYERIVKTNAIAAGETLKVTYKVGYGHDDTETLPMDIKHAVMRQVFQWYENRDEFLEGVYMSQVNDIIKMYQRKW